MKKIILLVIISVVSCCAEKEHLCLNLKKGATYTQKIYFTSLTIQTINGNENKTNLSYGMNLSFKVLSIQGNVYELEVRYVNMWTKMIAQNRLFEFSSEKHDKNDIFSTILNALTEKSFIVLMTRTGKVNQVKNLENMWIHLFERMPNLGEVERAQLKTQLSQSYGEKAFKGNIQMVTAIFPDSLVSIGDKWSVATQLEGGMAANIKAIYELKKVAGSNCIINGVAKIETANKDAYIKSSNGMPMKLNLKGTVTSEIKIDRKTGWVLDSRVNQSMSGDVRVKDNPQLPGGLIIPMTMDSETIASEK